MRESPLLHGNIGKNTTLEGSTGVWGMSSTRRRRVSLGNIEERTPLSKTRSQLNITPSELTCKTPLEITGHRSPQSIRNGAKALFEQLYPPHCGNG